MKGKKVTRLVIFTLIIIFIALYITQLTGYYEYTESKKTTLTKQAIEKFEKDVSSGKQIKAKNYLSEEKNYNNKASNLGMKISGLIEDSFTAIMNSIFSEVNKAVSNN